MLQLLHVGLAPRKGKPDPVGMLDHGSRVLQVLGRRGGQGAGSAGVARTAQVQPGLRAPVAWNRYCGFGVAQQQPELVATLMKTVFFDTCAYHLPDIRLLTEGVPVDNILFACEMVGAVKGIDVHTGHHFDDTKRYFDPVEALDEARRFKIFQGNARRVYMRLDALLTRRGHVALAP